MTGLLILQGVPEKIGLLSSFEFFGWGEVLKGVKNYSKNSGTKKNIGSYSKILIFNFWLVSSKNKFLKFLHIDDTPHTQTISLVRLVCVWLVGLVSSVSRLH